MSSAGALTNEKGVPIARELARFLRMDFGVVSAGGWPRQPPRMPDFQEDPTPGAPSSRLSAVLRDVKATLNKKKVCLGVLDLDAAPVSGVREIAGWGLDEQVNIGSTSKVWGMYAAFQLRDDLRAFVAANPGVSRPDLPARLKTAWRNSPIPGLKAVASSNEMPRLEQIFDLSALPAVDFLGMKDCGTSLTVHPSAATSALAASLETFHQHEYAEERSDQIHMWEALAAMPFGHRLWLSIAWSDNAAASTVLKDLGFSYVDAVLTGSRLYEPGRNSGARAAMNYFASPGKLLAEGVWPAGSLRTRISDFKHGQHGKPPRHAGTVRTLLCFAVSLQLGQVISAADSAQMLSLMRSPKWTIGARGAHVPAKGLDGKPMIDEDGDPEYVDGMSSFIVDAIDDYVDEPAVGLQVRDSYHAFAETAAKLGISRYNLAAEKLAEAGVPPNTTVGRYADVAIVDVPTTDGRRLHWAIAFTRSPATGKNKFKPDLNEYGQVLKEVITRWMNP